MRVCCRSCNLFPCPTYHHHSAFKSRLRLRLRLGIKFKVLSKTKNAFLITIYIFFKCLTYSITQWKHLPDPQQNLNFGVTFTFITRCNCTCQMFNKILLKIVMICKQQILHKLKSNRRTNRITNGTRSILLCGIIKLYIAEI